MKTLYEKNFIFRLHVHGCVQERIQDFFGSCAGGKLGWSENQKFFFDSKLFFPLSSFPPRVMKKIGILLDTLMHMCM